MAGVHPHRGADAIPLHIHHMRQSSEDDIESVRRPADRSRRMTDGNANRYLGLRHARGHGPDRSVNGLARCEHCGFAIHELEHSPPPLLSDASARSATGDEDVPQRRADSAHDHGCL